MTSATHLAQLAVLTLLPLSIMGTSVATSVVTTVLYTEESTSVVHVGVGVTRTVFKLSEGRGALRGLVMPAWPRSHFRMTTMYYGCFEHMVTSNGVAVLVYESTFCVTKANRCFRYLQGLGSSFWKGMPFLARTDRHIY